MKQIQIPDLVADVIKSKKSEGKGRRYLVELQACLGRFAKDFADRPVSSITTAEISIWLSSLRPPASVQRYRVLLVDLFGEAVNCGHVNTNPAIEAEASAVQWAIPKAVQSEIAVLTSSASSIATVETDIDRTPHLPQSRLSNPADRRSRNDRQRPPDISR